MQTKNKTIRFNDLAIGDKYQSADPKKHPGCVIYTKAGQTLTQVISMFGSVVAEHRVTNNFIVYPVK